MDSASQIAVDQTQGLLKSSPDRQKYIDDHASAKTADDKAAEVAGSNENKAEMYNIASGITRELATSNGGDSRKMEDVLDQGMKDPEAFYNSLSPADRAQIDALSKKIEFEKPAGLDRH